MVGWSSKFALLASRRSLNHVGDSKEREKREKKKKKQKKQKKQKHEEIPVQYLLLASKKKIGCGFLAVTTDFNIPTTCTDYRPFSSPVLASLLPLPSTLYPRQHILSYPTSPSSLGFIASPFVCPLGLGTFPVRVCFGVLCLCLGVLVPQCPGILVSRCPSVLLSVSCPVSSLAALVFIYLIFSPPLRAVPCNAWTPADNPPASRLCLFHPSASCIHSMFVFVIVYSCVHVTYCALRSSKSKGVISKLDNLLNGD
jgi:hypothetical protein